MLLETSRIKRIIAVIMIAMFLHSAAYPAQDSLRVPVGRQDTYKKISNIYNNGSYNSNAISLFEHMHENEITLDQLTSVMRKLAISIANVHRALIEKKIFQIQLQTMGRRIMLNYYPNIRRIL